MQNPFEETPAIAVAKRLDRCADRLLNVGRVSASLDARKLGKRVLRLLNDELAGTLEREFLERLDSLLPNRAKEITEFTMLTSSEYEAAAIAIDFGQVSKLEGGQILSPDHVPDLTGSNSGVTVGTGVDLGQMDDADIDALNISDTLKGKLKPYTELTGQEAEDYLKQHPITLTKGEADQLDKSIQSNAINKLVSSYRSATASEFNSLPPEAQTVIASVAFQYGNLATRTPSFWKAVTKSDWVGAVNELRNFKDNYPTRRKAEADLLQKALDRGAFNKKLP